MQRRYDKECIIQRFEPYDEKPPLIFGKVGTAIQSLVILPAYCLESSL
ncbi:hypothetical protein ACFVSS_25525 [Peribacillus butanolivorans]